MIEITGLTKTYPATRSGHAAFVALDGVDLRVDDGSIAAVVGPSGAGKSTLSRCINLLERPTSGSVIVNDEDLTRLRATRLRTARRQIGTVFQSASLLRRLTAAQNVALPLRNAGLPDTEIRSRTGELLDRVGMLSRANHYPAQLSGGQRQRVGIARALALRPSVLLSDEATSGLDPETTHAILELLSELRDDLGVTVLVITHEMEVVRSIADAVFQLDHGRIVESGPVTEVMLRSDSTLSRALLPVPPATVAGPLRSWTVRYRDHHVSPVWLTRAAGALGSDVALLAALVEESGATPVGRLTIGLSPSLDEDRVRTVLGGLGLVAAPLDARTASDEESAA